MKTINLLIFSLLIFCAGAQNQVQSVLAPPATNVNISNGTYVIDCSKSYNFYDSGGNNNDYSNSETIVMTFSVPSGCISFNFSSFATESCCDRLKIFDGPNGSSPLIGTYNGTSSPGTITSSGSTITFSFTSDGSIVDAGWVATIACTSPCSGSPVGGIAAATPSAYCGTFTSTLNVSGNSTGCGITYQWQSANSSAGPYSNITGATAASTVVTSTTTKYYRCVIACGTSTTASAPATASITNPGSCSVCNLVTVNSLPFSLSGQSTCGQGNNVTSSNVTNICGSSSYYGGEDATYAFTPTSTGALTIGVTSGGSYMGITLYQGCPLSGGNCIGYAQSSSGNQTLCASVSAGQTYYVVIDSWPSPTCNPYAINISSPGSCVGTISGANASASPATGCGTVNTTVNLTGFSACGPTFQWQSSTSASGPFTNISGATSQNLTAAVTTTTYYRALLTCGSATALSSVAGVSVSPTASVACSLSSYTSATTTYSFETFTGTSLPTTDDVLFSTIVNFGFPFCFGGSQYWGGYVASNGAFVFDAVPCFPNISSSTYAAGGVSTGYTIPSPAPVNSTSIPRNAVLGPWQDIHPGLGGTIKYYVTGTAPNRRFVVSYESIPMFSCGTSSPSIYFTGQIKLFETTNAIEIHVGNKGVCPTFNNGRAVMGLHSYDGTVYVPPVNATAHNSPTQWTMTNTAYRFQSPCAVNNGPCAVLPINFKSFYGEHFENMNKLYWSTSEESNVKHFIIERSTDAVNFKTLGYQLPKNSAADYSFSDRDIKNGTIYYYRITAEETDGQRKSTFIYPLGGNDELSISEIYPNPATNTFNIGVINKEQTFLNVSIKDMFGRVLSTSAHDAPVGVSSITLNAPASSGVYIVEVINTVTGKILSTQKLVVTK